MWSRIKSRIFAKSIEIDRLNKKIKRLKRDGAIKSAKIKELKQAMARSSDNRLKGCTRKVTYERREEAQCRAQTFGIQYKPYKCHYCTGWHLTTRKD